MRRPNFKNYKRRLRAYRIFSVLTFLGYLAIAIAVLGVIGTIGRSDYEVESRIIEGAMTFKQEFLQIMISLIIGGVGYIINCCSSYARDIQEDWIKRFESRWYIVEDDE